MFQEIKIGAHAGADQISHVDVWMSMGDPRFGGAYYP
jgi:hypothetical protein